MSLLPPEIPELSPNLVPQGPNEVIRDEETSRFNYPGSDIVLRSRDSYNFPLPKLNIVICSPVLRKLIESVSNTSDVLNGEEREAPSLPIVEIPESKETLYHLLTFIFPVAPVLPPTTEKIMVLLAVAQKYEMDSVVSHIRGAIALQDPPFLCLETAFQVYFLAQQNGLHQEAVQAARVTSQFPMTIEGLGDELGFPGMTGAYLHELWMYHEQVRRELKPAVHEFRDTGLPGDTMNLFCSSPYWGTSSPQWLYDYINSVAETPPGRLFDLTQFEEVWARHVESRNSAYGACSCATMPRQARRSFWEALKVVVHRALEKVGRIGVASTHRSS